MTTPSENFLTRDRVASALFLLGAGTWPFTAYPLYVGDQAGISTWDPASWAVPVLGLSLVLAGVGLAQASARRRLVAGGLVAGLAALLWLWPWGLGFYSADAWGDRFVASLAYPVLATAWVALRGYGPRAYLGLAPMALVMIAGTVMWPGPAGAIPWGTAWRANTWALGPVFLNISGAGLAALAAALASASLARRLGAGVPK